MEIPFLDYSRQKCNFVFNRILNCYMSIIQSVETFWIYRVESAANIADGPTRGDFTWMRDLKASFWDPILPKWMADLWAGPPRLLDPREFGNLFQ